MDLRAAAAVAIRQGRPAGEPCAGLAGVASGRAELCDVKSEERVDDPTFRAQVEATRLACAEAGIGCRVLSEPDQQLLVNVRWLAGFRERPPDPDGERARMLAALAAGPCTIAELMSAAREPMLARPVLMNLLWAGDALVDLSAAIGEDTVVRARLQVAAMSEARWPLSIGGRLLIDGEAMTVTSVDGAEVRGFTWRGEPVRFVLTRVEERPAEVRNDERRFGSVLWTLAR